MSQHRPWPRLSVSVYSTCSDTLPYSVDHRVGLSLKGGFHQMYSYSCVSQNLINTAGGLIPTLDFVERCFCSHLVSSDLHMSGGQVLTTRHAGAMKSTHGGGQQTGTSVMIAGIFVDQHWKQTLPHACLCSGPVCMFHTRHGRLWLSPSQTSAAPSPVS